MLRKLQVLRKTISQNNVLELLFYLSQLMLIKLSLVSKIFVLKSLEPIYLRNGTSDIPVFREIFLEKEYDVKIPHAVKYIIDGGANIGVSTLYFKIKFPNATIVAIEPEQENFDLLVKNTLSYNNIICLHAGIWFETTKVLVKKSDTFGEWGFQVEPISNDSSEGIQSYSIDDLIRNYNIPIIDILKLDIEGAERVLFESNNPEKWLNKCKLIIIELHDFIEQGTSKVFFERLDKCVHYDCYRSGENTVVTIKGAV